MPFNIIRVAGQSSLIADQSDDVLDIVAGSGVSITTNPSIDTITISASGGGGGGGLGYTGSEGPVGFTGSKGNTGGLGQTGFTGSAGAATTGFTGSHGDAGYSGSQGPTGFTGSTGSQGDVGYTGSQGDTGFTGSQGLGTQGYTGSSPATTFVLTCSGENSAITTGVAKSFRIPGNFTLDTVRASLATAQATGNLVTVDVSKNGVSVLSTKITLDNTEKSSVTASVQPMISVANFVDDDEVTINVDQIGDGTAKGLKVTLMGMSS